ncbi:MAG: 2-oxoacid:acceptor oxidoreductase subunit alpha [Candidatus Marinimicrobia bacterium]|nr:2-oxoacid:acceptor oxidoreductase subunit alpha [Candidatus Neomarinimicrobiota bacterium]
MDTTKQIRDMDDVVVRFAGDSGDGMQLIGDRFSSSSAHSGHDIATLPDYPSEIRAPAGTLAGVSAFQVNFSSRDIYTPGDAPDVLVAMNPAALKVHLNDLVRGGVIVANTAAFTGKNLKLAKYDSNPLEDGSLSGYHIYAVNMVEMVANATHNLNLKPKAIERCKNFFALGLLFWMYSHSKADTLKWLKKKFATKPELIEANIRAVNAGYNYGSTMRIFTTSYRVASAKLRQGKYRQVNGNLATVLGIVAAGLRMGREIFYGGYPITPASEIMHEFAAMKRYGVKMLQAEDEIAAVTAAIGASYAGNLACTATSGPGLALKSEALGLAIITELPMVVVDVQRGGPSTGLPTKPEQSDLNIAMYGRHGEAPMPVLCAFSPRDCFYAAYEASRIAVKYMTPVLLLTDGYLAQGAEPWRIPSEDELPEMDIEPVFGSEDFFPYARDEKTLARPWVSPGTPGKEHRIGGLEKEHIYGGVSHDPENHQFMTELRQNKVDGIALEIPPTEIFGDESDGLLILGWGGSYGAIREAVIRAREEGVKVSHVQVRYLDPLPPDLGDVLKRFNQVLIPETNMGQFRRVIQANYLMKPLGFNKVKGKPFRAEEIYEKIKEIAGEKS